MKAVAGPLPGDDEDGWAYEIKWDGMRVIAGIDDGIRAVSANGIDVTARFPELDGLPDHLGGHEAILDGEMVAFDGDRSDFARLQQRMHLTSRADAIRRSTDVPACFVVFDLLELDGQDTTGVPYLDRRRLLADLVEPASGWQVPPHRLGDGAALLEAATARGLEGLVAKRTASPYLPGQRSPTWRKIKVRREQELVVGGWTLGEGTRASTFGALLLGHHAVAGDGAPLRFAGACGTGFSAAEAARLRTLLDELASDTSPFAERMPGIIRHPRWVRPDLVVEVMFGEWTPDGRLRHPAYVGQRVDVDPGLVIREPSP
jgi:bifunctional non-homologous end joining protein LigD